MKAKRRRAESKTAFEARLNRMESSLNDIRLTMKNTQRKVDQLSQNESLRKEKSQRPRRKNMLYSPAQHQSVPKKSPSRNVWYPNRSAFGDDVQDSKNHTIENINPKPSTVSEPNWMGELNQMLNLFQHPALKPLFQLGQTPTTPPPNTGSNQVRVADYTQLLKILENPSIQSLLKKVL